jgi:hypothetical protein
MLVPPNCCAWATAPSTTTVSVSHTARSSPSKVNPNFREETTSENFVNRPNPDFIYNAEMKAWIPVLCEANLHAYTAEKYTELIC